jgi:predicted transcriptional regulator
MAVISIRLNAEEEKMISFLAEEYERDKSGLIRLSLQQMYENYVDRKVIEEYEKKEKKSRKKFLRAEDIIKNISDF